MRIVYARNLYRPVDFGGNRYAFEVTQRLARRGHDVSVVTGRIAGRWDAPAFPVETYPFSRANPLLTFTTHALLGGLALRRAIRRRRPDVVMMASYDLAYGALLLGAMRRMRTVYFYHSRFVTDAVDRVALKRWPLRLAHRPLATFVNSVERTVLNSADRIVAVSEFSRDEISTLAGVGAAANATVIPTGVDIEQFTPGDRVGARAELGIASDALALVCVGRFAPVKRYDRAIQVVARLRQRTGRPVVLMLVGAGPERRRLERVAEELAVTDAVRFEGFRSGDELLTRLRAADFMLCTSQFENWSLSLLEGLACGLPVLTTPFGGTPQMVRPVSAELVLDVPDPDMFVDRIMRLSSRPEELATIGRDARLHAERFGWESVVDKVEAELAPLTYRA